MSFLTRQGPTPEEIARENYIKKNITETLGLALKTLQQKHVNSEEPIYSEDSANTVCNILEAVFLHGLKSSFSTKLSSYLIGINPAKARPPCFWEMLTRFSHKDAISQLNHLGQITTEVGMCRAWLRVALNDGVLESYLDAMLADKPTLRCYYTRMAYLRDEEHTSILMSYIKGLLCFRFQLSYNSSVLNLWTTTPLVMAGLMEQSVVPRAAMSTSLSDDALTCTASLAQVQEVQRVQRTKAAEPSISSSFDDQADLQVAGRVNGTSGGTPHETSTLTRSDIEEIRQLGQRYRTGAGSASTPPSQISWPDYLVDGSMQSPPSESGFMEEAGNVPEMAVTPVVPWVRSPRSRSSRGVFGEVADEERLDIIDEDESPQAGLPATVIEDTGGGAEPVICSMDGDCINEDSQCESTEAVAAVPQVEKQEEKQVEEEEDKQNIASAAAASIEPEIPIIPEDNIDNSSQDSSQQQQVTPATEPRATRPTTLQGWAPRSNLPLSLMKRRKSEPLTPVLSDVTADVEVAREVSPSQVLSSDSDEQPALLSSLLDPSLYHRRAPSPKGNKLGAMQGWSSEFEPEDFTESISSSGQQELPAPIERHHTLTTQESYNSLLRNYGAGPVAAASMSDVLQQLPQAPSVSLSPSENQRQDIEDTDYPDDYEVLSLNLNVTSEQADSRTQQLVSVIGKICNEKGLDQQNYQCNACSRPIGMIYGKARVCTYDGCYYCFECHENEESVIPSRIVHNWDFSKQKVACHTVRFLKQIEEDPLINIQHINPRLYDHVSEVKEVKDLRIQLWFLKAYLFTCKQSVADDLRKQVWPKEYLYDDIHLYSLQDLLQIPTGQLATSIRKVIKFAAKHVYDCRLCSQKGFICEVCQSPKVIYPFEVDTTWRCEQCNSVYHVDCKPTSRQCIRCKRRRHRQMSHSSELGASQDSDDYAYGPD